MNVRDFFSESQKETIPEDAIKPFQDMLTLNIDDMFQKNLSAQIDRMMHRTGTCVLIPMSNSPALCREGIARVENLRDDGTLFLPMVHNVFGVTPNPGDPVIFCIVSNAVAGIRFEWEHLYDLFKRGKIKLINTTAQDMQQVERYVSRELNRLRKEHAKEKAKNVRKSIR